ncbi:MAG: DUF4280 domain-containing protein [Solirubrobacteraceae bacterium]
MTVLVANGAQIMCDLGTTPSVLTVIPGPPHIAASSPPPAPLATITDFVPLTNIASFGMCMSPANPAVQAATAAASGVFTPAPCVPATAGPWAPAATVLVSGVPAFDQTATCHCAWAGTVAVVNPGQAVAVTGV